jgi:uncharacterized protein
MATELDSQRLDVVAFARAAATLSGTDSLSKYERLAQEAQAQSSDLSVNWTASGEWREPHAALPQAWLHVQADAVVPLTCQRCLTGMDTLLDVDRWFRFVADEAAAEAQDDEAEEDLLVVSPHFDLVGLVEDELLLALPMVPTHETCPVHVQLEAVDEGFEEAAAAKPNPFAALAGLNKTGR